MEYIEKIKKMLCKELDEYAMKGKISGADLEMIFVAIWYLGVFVFMPTIIIKINMREAMIIL